MKTLTLLLSFFVIGTFAGAASAAEGGTPVQNIIITKKGSIEASKRSQDTFTGDVSSMMLAPQREDSRLSAGFVMFQPGARTNWHTHPYGQLLIILEGRGLVQEWDGQTQQVSAGDLVWCPAGVKHWHGADQDSAMSHYALQEELDGSPVTWMEKVTDEQYNTK